MGISLLETIKLQGYEYFIEYDDSGNLFLTRCLSECGDCEHYETDCHEHNYPDGDFYCDRERPDVPDTYDIYDYISEEDYPELSEDERQRINKLLANADPEFRELLNSEEVLVVVTTQDGSRWFLCSQEMLIDVLGTHRDDPDYLSIRVTGSSGIYELERNDTKDVWDVTQGEDKVAKSVKDFLEAMDKGSDAVKYAKSTYGGPGQDT